MLLGRFPLKCIFKWNYVEWNIGYYVDFISKIRAFWLSYGSQVEFDCVENSILLMTCFAYSLRVGLPKTINVRQIILFFCLVSLLRTTKAIRLAAGPTVNVACLSVTTDWNGRPSPVSHSIHPPHSHTKPPSSLP